MPHTEHLYRGSRAGPLVATSAVIAALATAAICGVPKVSLPKINVAGISIKNPLRHNPIFRSGVAQADNSFEDRYSAAIRVLGAREKTLQALIPNYRGLEDDAFVSGAQHTANVVLAGAEAYNHKQRTQNSRSRSRSGTVDEDALHDLTLNGFGMAFSRRVFTGAQASQDEVLSDLGGVQSLRANLNRAYAVISNPTTDKTVRTNVLAALNADCLTIIHTGNPYEGVRVASGGHRKMSSRKRGFF